MTAKSILQRKIERSDSLAPEFSRLHKIWDDFSEKCPALLRGKSSLTLTPDVINQNVTAFGKLLEEWGDSALVFPFSDASAQKVGFFHLPMESGIPLSLNTLGQTDDPDPLPEANIYDLFLLKPIAQSLTKNLSDCMDMHLNNLPFLPLSLTAPVLKCKDLKSEKLPEALLCVEMTFADEESGTRRSVNLFLAMPLAESLAMDLPDADSPLEIDEQALNKIKGFILEATIPVAAELDSLSMNVGECYRLKIDDILPLPDTSLDQIQLRARTEGGRALLSTGQLGMLRGQKSVKLQASISEEFFGPIEILHGSAH